MYDLPNAKTGKKNQLNDLFYSDRLQSLTFTALGTQPNYTVNEASDW